MLGIGNYFWRLIPANPILLRVVETGGKRKRDLFIRCGYLGALLAIVIFLLLQSAGSLASASLADLSKQSAELFIWMSYVQLGLVALLAPVFTAGAITQERDSQTYDILLSTPLTNGQIVLGSLLSRLFFVVALLISGIPIFSITQIFGGVAIKDIIMSFLIAVATAFITGALAMAIAVFKVGTRRTIFAFYLFTMVYVAVPMVIESLGYLQHPGGKGPESHVSWMAGLHPFLALKVIFHTPTYIPPEPAAVNHYGYFISWYLSSPQTFYVTFMLVASFVLVAPSIVVLRRIAQSNMTLRSWVLQLLRLSTGDKTRKPRHVWANPIAWREAKTKASASRALLLRYGFMIVGIGAAVTLAVFSSMSVKTDSYVSAGGYNELQKTVTLTYNGQTRPFRIKLADEMGVRPTVIKLRVRDPAGGPDLYETVGPEMLREGMCIDPNHAEFRIQEGPQVVDSIVLSYPAAVLSDERTRQFLTGAILLEFSIILLIVTQSAASTVTREKEDGTLDLLLSTPITSRYYIWGKLRGLVSFVIPLVAVPIGSLLVFVGWDLLRPLFVRGAQPASALSWTVFPEAVLVLPATIIMVAAFAAILGMQMSLRCRKTVMAVIASVGIVAGASGALWLCGGSAAGSSNLAYPGLAVGAFSPFTLVAVMVNPTMNAHEVFNPTADDFLQARLFLFFCGWAAAAAYGLIVWAMYKSMVRNFDMTIRKQAT